MNVQNVAIPSCFCLYVYTLLIRYFIESLMFKLYMKISSGTINGLLFYANIVKLDKPMLLPTGSIPVLIQYI